jgi:hypothetical protein
MRASAAVMRDLSDARSGGRRASSSAWYSTSSWESAAAAAPAAPAAVFALTLVLAARRTLYVSVGFRRRHVTTTFHTCLHR